MKALMNSWRRRAEAYSLWYTSDDEDCPPLISFSLDAFSYDLRPAAYYDYNDKDRWRIFQIRIAISRRLFVIHIPYKKLPDYIPTGKAMLRTRAIGNKNKDERDALVEMLNASKKV